MTIHEFGIAEKNIVLVHPSMVMWDYFEYIIPLLQEDYRLIIPALPGYDGEHPDKDFTSVEEIAAALSKWLTEHGINTVDILYGCSMGAVSCCKCSPMGTSQSKPPYAMEVSRPINYHGLSSD